MLRGFTAFDIFLEQHPEFREQVTFIAHLQPSRQDVPEYVEYLEKIEALVAVINHRHGTTDWMPIDLRLRDDFEEAVALYKHFDLLLVNAMWDGMNLVSKEGPLVNTRDGMMILSENTGAHEELGACALSVNPFDVQEQADAMYTGADRDAGGARSAACGCCATSSSPARPPTGSTTSSPTSRRSARRRTPWQSALGRRTRLPGRRVGRCGSAAGRCGAGDGRRAAASVPGAGDVAVSPARPRRACAGARQRPALAGAAAAATAARRGGRRHTRRRAAAAAGSPAPRAGPTPPAPRAPATNASRATFPHRIRAASGRRSTSC